MTTATIEYRDVLNREDWPSGAWDGEPDKIQWIDATTDLDCLMVRNASGAWCGYVGVPEAHPWFGVEYNQCALKPPCGESCCDHTPEHLIRVHGGLTFSDACSDATPLRFEQFRKSMAESVDEARKYPKGESARRIRDFSHLVNDFAAYQRYAESRFICHKPLDGRPAHVWWFGFDTAHAGDEVPGMVRFNREHGFGFSGVFGPGQYRNRAYVEKECARLARQLRAVANGELWGDEEGGR